MANRLREYLMKISDITKFKHLAQDKISRTANPAIVRNSTILFKTIQELQKKLPQISF